MLRIFFGLTLSHDLDPVIFTGGATGPVIIYDRGGGVAESNEFLREIFFRGPLGTRRKLDIVQ